MQSCIAGAHTLPRPIWANICSTISSSEIPISYPVTTFYKLFFEFLESLHSYRSVQGGLTLTMNSMHCIIFIVFCVLYYIRYIYGILCVVICPLFYFDYILYIVRSALCSMHCILCNVSYALYFMLCIVFNALYYMHLLSICCITIPCIICIVTLNLLTNRKTNQPTNRQTGWLANIHCQLQRGGKPS
jgi:hypothetical protein